MEKPNVDWILDLSDENSAANSRKIRQWAWAGIEKGKLDAPRFHAAFLMQNTPEVVCLYSSLDGSASLFILQPFSGAAGKKSLKVEPPEL